MNKEEHLNWPDTPPTLTTQRLILRPFQLSDAGRVQHLAGNKNVALKTTNIPYPYPDGLAEEWIASHSRNWKERTGLTYAIVEKTSGELIGAIGFVELTDSTGELGYWIGEPYWGNGYCTEAARKLVEFGIQELNLKKIYATYLSSNPASGKVMEKLGMKLVKSFYRPFRGKKRVKIKYYELTVPSSS